MLRSGFALACTDILRSDVTQTHSVLELSSVEYIPSNVYVLSQGSVGRPGVGESPQCSVVVPDRVFTAPFLSSQLSRIEFPLFPPLTLFFKLEICAEVRRLSSSKLLGFFDVVVVEGMFSYVHHGETTWYHVVLPSTCSCAVHCSSCF